MEKRIFRRSCTKHSGLLHGQLPDSPHSRVRRSHLPVRVCVKSLLRYVIVFACGLSSIPLPGISAAENESSKSILIAIENEVEVSIKSTRWISAKKGQKLDYGDRVRTGEFSRATVKLPTGSILRIDELSTVRLQPPKSTTGKPNVELRNGRLYFFGKIRGEETEVSTPIANGAIRGTEFELSILAANVTVLTLIDGEVDLSTAEGTVAVRSGERGRAEPSAPPTKTAVIDAVSTIQWCLYYPGVIDPAEFDPSVHPGSPLFPALTAYRRGNPVAAVARFPFSQTETMGQQARLFAAALALSVGRAEEIGTILQKKDRQTPVGLALEELVATVQGRKPGAINQPLSASQWLARSYTEQAAVRLEAAREAALKATELSPEFGYAWARLAEMEFSFGRLQQMDAALEKARRLSPENAQAIALQGFVLAGRHQMELAEERFQEAVDLDPALGNARLGRGLARIAQGRYGEGQSDLQAAAAMEPTRSLLRSYLGKSFAGLPDFAFAERELDLAEKLDSNDPTPFLYRAFLNRSRNQFNRAIRDLEASLARNENRRLFRSRLLLDQDRAVRSANLAEIYQLAGLDELALTEAGRGVAADYGNYAAHIFLSNAYNELRDPLRINLRFEVAWANELFLANILSPVGARSLSPAVTQQEYSRLFSKSGPTAQVLGSFTSAGRDRVSATHGNVIGQTQYSIDLEYTRFDEFFFNDDLERTVIYGSLKHQFTPKDTAYLLFKYQDAEIGDVFLRYDANLRITESPNGRDPDFRFRERQEPLTFLSWRREWAPGQQTLLLFSRLQNEQDLSDDRRRIPLILGVGGTPTSTLSPQRDWNFSSDLEIYSGEVQQLHKSGPYQFLGGLRIQQGDVRNTSAFDGTIVDDLTEGFSRTTGYGYATRALSPTLTLTAGITYDRIEFPATLTDPPFIPGKETREHLGPKFGLVWTPAPNWTGRAAFSRVQTGFNIDEPVRLEPNQVAGFIQAFRSVIPQNLTGSLPAAQIDTYNVGLEGKIGEQTYLGLGFFFADSEVKRTRGSFFRPSVGATITTLGVQEAFAYEEVKVSARIDRLIGDRFSSGIQIQWNRA